MAASARRRSTRSTLPPTSATSGGGRDEPRAAGRGPRAGSRAPAVHEPVPRRDCARRRGTMAGRHPPGDGIVTAATDLALVVLVADCVPVLLSDHFAGVIGAVHAGRAGLLAGVVQRAMDAMHDLGARHVDALVGPSVCGRCYEVPDAPASAGHRDQPARRDGVVDRLAGPRHRRRRGGPARHPRGASHLGARLYPREHQTVLLSGRVDHRSVRGGHRAVCRCRAQRR